MTLRVKVDQERSRVIWATWKRTSASDLRLARINGLNRNVSSLHSKSKYDPLSFGKWRKIGLLVSVVWFSVIALSVIGGFGAIAPVFFGLYARRRLTLIEDALSGTDRILIDFIRGCRHRQHRQAPNMALVVYGTRKLCLLAPLIGCWSVSLIAVFHLTVARPLTSHLSAYPSVDRSS